MTNDELNKPRQFWINHSKQVRYCEAYRKPLMEGHCIHVIELAPMLKMMEEMAEANEKLMIETYCLMTQVRYPKRLENLTKDDGSVAFAYHNARERLESYQAFKRENGLE